MDADAMAHKIPYHRKPLALHDALHRGAHIAQSRPRPNRRDAGLQRLFGHLQ